MNHLIVIVWSILGDPLLDNHLKINGISLRCLIKWMYLELRSDSVGLYERPTSERGQRGPAHAQVHQHEANQA